RRKVGRRSEAADGGRLSFELIWTGDIARHDKLVVHGIEKSSNDHDPRPLEVALNHGSPSYLSRHHVSRYQGLNHPASTFNKYKLRIESVLAEESNFIGEPCTRACGRDGTIADGDLLEGLRCCSVSSDCRARRGNRKSPQQGK